MSQVRLEIYGERGVITADTLVTAVQRTLKVLREVDRTSRGGDASRGHWRVNEVWNGSIGLALEPSADIAARGAASARRRAHRAGAATGAASMVLRGGDRERAEARTHPR